MWESLKSIFSFLYMKTLILVIFRWANLDLWQRNLGYLFLLHYDDLEVEADCGYSYFSLLHDSLCLPDHFLNDDVLINPLKYLRYNH